MKTHDNQKPFQCTVCNRGYNTAAALTSHMQGHKRDREGREPDRRRPLRCLRCGDAFRRPDLLQVNAPVVRPLGTLIHYFRCTVTCESIWSVLKDMVRFHVCVYSGRRFRKLIINRDTIWYCIYIENLITHTTR